MSIPSPTGVDRVLGGKYRVDELLGMGGFGAVYRGWHLLLDVPVAIKIAFHFDGTPSQRFRREARTLMRLRHPHIVRVYDYGREEDGRTYMVQEFVEGLPLDTVIGALGPLDPATAIRVALQTLDALGEAHRSGVVHRDVKPGNLMVRDHPDGVWVQLLDFGVAQVDGSVDALLDDASPERTRPGAALGTPAYMAPEQIQGRAAPASDLYALGVTLFRVLTGRCPFPQPAPAVYLAHLGEPVPALPSTVPAALAAVIHRAMAKAPADRYPSAEAMAAALEAALETLPARPSSPLVARVPREARRPVGPLASAPTAPTAPTAPEEHAGEAPSAAALHPERASVEPISDLASPDLTSGD
ncbi:MAG: serine/threonine protein kinase, partial [Myxococcales bacterium]|nr:serine/threonine protein kinase [Myxococcales bacterium]